nr:hypothetical protein [Acinetobacter sp. Marseille-Q1620]
MTFYKKLKIAIFLGIYTQTIHAIVFEPLQVQSGPGELLYAEMPFKNSNTNQLLQVSLASNDDLSSIGIVQKIPGNINFYTRRSGNGTGVIVITSSRPIIDSELNFVVKVIEGQSTRLQQIKTTIRRREKNSESYGSPKEKLLTPQIVVSEKDIALQLPESNAFQKPTTPDKSGTQETFKSLAIHTGNPPALNQSKIENSAINIQSIPEKKPVNASGQRPEQSIPNDDQTKLPSSKKAKAYVVKSNETLWGIAAKIAAKNHRKIHDVMREIKENNQHAFIQGNENRLRQGVALNLAALNTPSQPKYNQKPKTIKSNAQAYKKTKYRLDQAEMSLVASQQSDSSLSATANQATQNTKLNTQLVQKRQNTLYLQKQVSQSELNLKLKEQRIQILNAKLAQLQQQLQQQENALKLSKKQNKH